MITTLRNKLINALTGTQIIEDPEMEETIYPIVMHGKIAVRNLDGDVDLYTATGIVNSDGSLTLANNGNIIAYYPPATYESTFAL